MLDIIFWKGFLIGLLIAFPSGPVGFITLRRSYLFGVKSALYSTLGATISDLFYGVVVGFGLKKIAKFLVILAPYTQIVAGIFLVVLGARSFYRRLDVSKQKGKNTPFQDITSNMVLNALNPTLIFSFTVLFGMIGMTKYVGQVQEIVTFLVGMTTGVFIFWISVSFAIKKLQERAKERYIQKIYQYTGAILAIVGCILLILSVIHIIF